MRHNPLIDLHVLEQLHEQCFSWALTCTRGDRGEAEDVLQMTYLAIVEGEARYGGTSSLKTFLFAVIRNQARSRWRRARHAVRTLARFASQAGGAESAGEADALGDYPGERLNRRILAAWQSLPSRQREVLELVFYRDLSLSEAAEVLGVALGTARIHYERGKASLRRRLAGEEGLA